MRQFANAIEHALGIGRSEWIEPEDLPSSVTEMRNGRCEIGFELQLSSAPGAKFEREIAVADSQLPYPLFHGHVGICNSRIEISTAISECPFAVSNLRSRYPVCDSHIRVANPKSGAPISISDASYSSYAQAHEGRP